MFDLNNIFTKELLKQIYNETVQEVELDTTGSKPEHNLFDERFSDYFFSTFRNILFSKIRTTTEMELSKFILQSLGSLSENLSELQDSHRKALKNLADQEILLIKAIDDRNKIIETIKARRKRVQQRNIILRKRVRKLKEVLASEKEASTKQYKCIKDSLATAFANIIKLKKHKISLKRKADLRLRDLRKQNQMLKKEKVLGVVSTLPETMHPGDTYSIDLGNKTVHGVITKAYPIAKKSDNEVGTSCNSVPSQGLSFPPDLVQHEDRYLRAALNNIKDSMKNPEVLEVRNKLAKTEKELKLLNLHNVELAKENDSLKNKINSIELEDSVKKIKEHEALLNELRLCNKRVEELQHLHLNSTEGQKELLNRIKFLEIEIRVMKRGYLSEIAELSDKAHTEKLERILK